MQLIFCWNGKNLGCGLAYFATHIICFSSSSHQDKIEIWRKRKSKILLNIFPKLVPWNAINFLWMYFHKLDSLWKAHDIALVIWYIIACVWPAGSVFKNIRYKNFENSCRTTSLVDSFSLIIHAKRSVNLINRTMHEIFRRAIIQDLLTWFFLNMLWEGMCLLWSNI